MMTEYTKAERRIINRTISDLTPSHSWAKGKLVKFMGELSEEYYSASWMHGWEYTLWTALHVKPRGTRVRADDLDELAKLSEAAGGWVRFKDDEGPVFVPLNNWLRHLRHKKQRENYHGGY